MKRLITIAVLFVFAVSVAVPAIADYNDWPTEDFQTWRDSYQAGSDIPAPQPNDCLAHENIKLNFKAKNQQGQTIDVSEWMSRVQFTRTDGSHGSKWKATHRDTDLVSDGKYHFLYSIVLPNNVAIVHSASLYSWHNWYTPVHNPVAVHHWIVAAKCV